MGTEILRFVGGCSLLALPGSWVAFGFPLQGWSFALRLAVAIILSPVVVTIEFFILRWLGLSFSQNAWTLVVLNAGALWLIWRFPDRRLPSAQSAKYFVIVFLLLALCATFPWLVYSRAHMFTGHTLMHTGFIYQIEAGQPYLDDPEMAGLRLAYQWPGHVDWAVLSWIFDWAPTRTYVLTHLAWLAAFCVVLMAIARHCGSSVFGSALAAVWMGLGTNIVSQMFVWGAQNLLHRTATLRGDLRFTPWVRKFAIFELSAYGAVLLAVVILAGIRAVQTKKPEWLGLALFSYVGLGLIYPAILPVAAIFAGVLFLEFCFSFAGGKLRADWRPAAFFVLVAGSATALLALYLAELTRDRTIPAITFSTFEAVTWKLKSAPFVLAPFLAAAVLLPIRQLKSSPLRLLLMTAGLTGVATVFLNVGRNGTEYKLVLGIAILLAPLVGLAADLRLKTPLGRCAAGLMTILLLAPALTAMRQQWALMSQTALPYLRDDSFFVRLDETEPDREWIEVIRERTPRDTALVVRATKLYLPALTNRSLWAPPAPEIIPGYWFDSYDNLMNNRGYSEALYRQRQKIVAHLFSDVPEQIAAALAELQKLGRPVAFILDRNEGRVLREVIRSRKDGQLLYTAPRRDIWLLFNSPEKRPGGNNR